MQKRGKTATGKQRWLCAKCNKSHSLGHETQQRGRLLDRFVIWLMGKQSQIELKSGFTDRTWRAQTSWCWDIIPKPELTGEVHEIILIDGIRISNLVCLIARTPTAVIDWLWVLYESSYSWSELLIKLPSPIVIVCDGQKDIC